MSGQFGRDYLDDPFGRSVGLAAKCIRRRLTDHFHKEGHDITAMQWILLGNLLTHEGMTQQEITELLEQDKTAVTRLIDVLETKKLVRRVPNKADRRQNTLYVTEKGKRHCRNLAPLAELTQREALRGIPQSDVAVCKAVLRRVIDNLASS